MGDEIGLLNDRTYLDVPDHAADNRWLHRPRMDWAAAGRCHERATVEGRIFAGLRSLIERRRRTPQLSAAAPLRILDGLESSVFGFVREHPLGWLIALHGFGDRDAVVDPARLPKPASGILLDLLDGSRRLATRPVVVPARGVLWLVADGLG
jgi:amylosucrase